MPSSRLPLPIQINQGITTKQLITTLALTLVIASPAQAEWELIGAGENHIYADMATIRRDRAVLKVWVVYDLTNPITAPKEFKGIGWSIRMLHEIDCANAKIRTISTSLLSKHMALGEQLGSEETPNTGWIPVAPATAGNTEFYTICNYAMKMKL